MVEITCDWQKFSEVKDKLDDLGIEADLAEISQIPENYSALEDDKKEKLQKMIDFIEDLDDVQSVHHNGEL